MSKPGVLICGHGSRDEAAVAEFGAVARTLQDRLLGDYDVDYGYLEFATPILRDGLDNLRRRGVTEVLAVPGMLFAAGHAKNDIPSVLNTYMTETGLQIRYGRELGIDTRMVRAAADRIGQALDGAGRLVDLEDTLLMVVGRGSSDPDANSNVSKVARLLWEGMGFGWSEVCYSGVTFPLVEPGLRHAARLGYKRIVVFPYFLFTGILVRRIYSYVDIVASDFPDIEFVKAPYLNGHELVLQTFEARLEEILSGSGNMNCQLCKYREQVLGFEAEIGAVQESHHHHVEGIGTDTGGGQDDLIKSDHHHHHHQPYPHAAHRHGPKSLRKGLGG